MAAAVWLPRPALAARLLVSLAAAGAGAHARVCDGRVAVPPVRGEVREWKTQQTSGTHGAGQSYWDLLVQDGKDSCSYTFPERPQVADCLTGAWVVLIGASNANIWTIILANLLAPDAVLPKQDNFNIDGVFTQLIDIIIEDGKVVYKQVAVDPRVNRTGHEASQARAGAHEVERDRRVLRQAFAEVARAPRFSAKAIRITHFLAQFWDGAALALEAVRDDRGWAAAEVTMAISVGLWYKNMWNCRWRPCSRPSYTKLTAEELYSEYRRGLRGLLPALEELCSPGGRAGRRGCAVTSIEHCPLMKIPFWHKLRDSMVTVMQNESRALPLLRFVDLWQLTGQIPEACLGGHQTPMSALLTWQVLLSGMCPAPEASRRTLVAFRGETCRAAQVSTRCSWKKIEALGYKYEWDCAVSQPCTPHVLQRPEDVRLVHSTGPHVILATTTAAIPATTTAAIPATTTAAIPATTTAAPGSGEAALRQAPAPAADQSVLEAAKLLISISDGVVQKDDAAVPQSLLRVLSASAGSVAWLRWVAWPSILAVSCALAALAGLAAIWRIHLPWPVPSMLSFQGRSLGGELDPILRL